jgi:hypothetical protein
MTTRHFSRSATQLKVNLSSIASQSRGTWYSPWCGGGGRGAAREEEEEEEEEAKEKEAVVVVERRRFRRWAAAAAGVGSVLGRRRRDSRAGNASTSTLMFPGSGAGCSARETWGKEAGGSGSSNAARAAAGRAGES